MKTVSNRIALHCLNHCQREGRDPAQLLQEAGIAREELLLPHGRIDAQRHFRLLTQVAPHVDLAHKWSPPSLSGLFADYLPLASLCCNSANLRQALHFFLAYRPLIGECDRIVLREEEGEARLSYHSESDHPDVIAMSSLANLGHLYALLQFYHPGQGLLVLPTPVRPSYGASWQAGWGSGCNRESALNFASPHPCSISLTGSATFPCNPCCWGSSMARCGCCARAATIESGCLGSSGSGSGRSASIRPPCWQGSATPSD